MELYTGIAIGAGLMWLVSSLRRQDARNKAREWDLSNPENQMRFLTNASLYWRKPITTEAYKTVFVTVERMLTTIEPRHRLLAEVGMGSFIGTTGPYSPAAKDRAFKSFNSKRVDFLVIDAYGEPALAIEYHGTGHHLGSDPEPRDAVKRLALENAGVPLLEFREGVSRTEVEHKVRRSLLDRYQDRLAGVGSI